MATLDTILNIKVEGTSQMVKLKDAIDKTSEELKTLKKESKQAGADQKAYNAKIITAETKLKGLRSELNAGKTAMVKNAKAAADSSKSYNALTKQNAALSQKLRALKDPLGKNSAEFKKLSGQIKSNTDTLKQMDSAMGRSQRNVGNYKGAITGMATAVTGAVMAFKAMQSAISVFTDFEFQIKQVGVISGATAEEMEMLTESAKELGRTTTFTAGEVAGFQKELAKLGFDPTQINNMTESVLNLAFAFGDDLTATGEQVGGILRSFELDASQAAHVTDVLAVAFSKSALDLTKLTNAMPKVGAAANALGFDLEGTTALLGTLVNANIDASTAGTSLRNIFLKLADSTSPLSVALGGSVTSVDQLVPALQNLQASGVDLNAMLELTDQRAVTAFATLLKGSDDVDTLTDAMRNSDGTAQEFSDTMLDSLTGSFAELQSSAEGMVIEFIDELSPAIKLITDGLAGFFGIITSLLPTLKKLMIGFVSYKAAVLAAKIQQNGFRSALGLSKTAQLGFNVSVKAGTISVKAFNKAIKLNPLGLLVSGLAIGGAYLLDYAMATDDTTESVEELNDEIEEEVTALQKLVDAQTGAIIVSEDLMKKEHEQVAELGQLVATIKDVSASTKDRAKALEEFNEIAGTNISNLEDEKSLIDDLDKAYKNTVESIKQKIIIQAAEESMIELLTRQIEIEKELIGLGEENTQKTEEKIRVENELLAIDVKRQLQGKITSADAHANMLVSKEDLTISRSLTMDNLNLNTNINKKLLEQNLVLGKTQDTKQTISQLSNEELTNLQNVFQTESKLNEIMSNGKTIRENMAHLEEQGIDLAGVKIGQDSELFGLYMDQKNARFDQKQTEMQIFTLTNENSEIEKGILNIMEEKNDASKILEKLLLNVNNNGEKELDNYELVNQKLKEKEKALKVVIASQELEKQQYLKGIEEKDVSDAERNAKLLEIEEKYKQKISDASADVVDARNDVNDVEQLILETYKDIDAQTKIISDTTAEYVAKTQAQIAADKLQLESWQKLEDAGANLAEERIRLAIKVAKAELDLAMIAIQASDETTDAQVQNINNLKESIAGLEKELGVLTKSDDEQEGGFMNKFLWGTDGEDGQGITGEDFVQSLNQTFDSVGAIMQSFNQLQQQELATSVGVLEDEKSAAVKEFEESNEFAVMSEEEKADRILEIEKGFDDDILALKQDQFKKDQDFQIGMALMSGAQAVMNILAGTATNNLVLDGILKAMMIATTVATTALQIATIKAQKPPTAELGGIMDDSFFAHGGMVHGRSHAQGGEKFAVGGRVVELEGGESVINKRSTAMFKPLLSNINQMGGGRKFADGGMLFDSDTLNSESSMLDTMVQQLNAQKVYLVESDVTRSQKTVKTIESRVTF
tara:strand:+ start:10930 stop:15075 length:4146 start_codon:yes stop_codon:yes gene_type:complete